MNNCLKGLSALALIGSMTLTGCGGGSSSAGSPVMPSTSTKPSAKHATVSLSFKVPQNDSQASPASVARKPQFISPGENNITLIVDGAKVLNLADINASTSPTTSPDGNTTVSVTFAALGTYYVYTIGMDTIPGTHQIGVEVLGNKPHIILSEAQATYTLQPGANPAATMTLLGALSTGYIECSNGPVDSTNCASSYAADSTVGTGGVYTLTAIGADYDGFPIAFQANTGFDNGGFKVVETDGNNVLGLTNNGPFTSPGTQLLGNSGGFYVSQQAYYGQPFNARCLKLGTATLALQNSTSGPTTKLAGETYTYFDPSTDGSTGNYPGAGTLALGSKTPGNPAYHGGMNPNPVTTLMTINCDASLALTIN
jgi:hypothetical protein